LDCEDAKILVDVSDQPCTGIDLLVDVCTHVWGVWGVFSMWLQADMELTTKRLQIHGY
jgi:hypothetical protein